MDHLMIRTIVIDSGFYYASNDEWPDPVFAVRLFRAGNCQNGWRRLSPAEAHALNRIFGDRMPQGDGEWSVFIPSIEPYGGWR